jgi:mannose-6-phosphate isomerase
MDTPRLDQPLFFQPLFVERVWGGNRLGKLFGKALPPGKVIGESWELSDRPNEQTAVAGGPNDGWSLRKLMERAPEELLGEALAARRPPFFPLLLKYIDAGQDLSVQVHPGDEDCRKLGLADRGKTECWVVLHAEPGSRINRGLKPGVTREGFEQALKAGRVAETLHYFPARPGDVIAIPPGMVHAIGAGVVLAEIQQNSDLTFRVHDYDRKGLDGKPRALHLPESLATIRFAGPAPGFFQEDMTADRIAGVFDAMPGAAGASPAGRGRPELAGLLHGRYFDLRRLRLPPGAAWRFEAPAPAATVVMCLRGQGRLAGRTLRGGDTLLLPAALSAAHAELSASGSGAMDLLLSRPTPEA